MIAAVICALAGDAGRVRRITVAFAASRHSPRNLAPRAAGGEFKHGRSKCRDFWTESYHRARARRIARRRARKGYR